MRILYVTQLYEPENVAGLSAHLIMLELGAREVMR